MKLHIGLLTVIAGSLASLSSLEAARFPLTFRLCAYRLDGSKERFESVGYLDEERMFLGQSRFDDSKFGWSGHGVNMGAAEMLAATNFDWPALITKVEYNGEEKDLKPILHQKIHGCFTFDPNDYYSMTEGGELFITVAKTENLALSVYIEDRELTVWRRSLKSSSAAYSGAKVGLADLGQTWTKKYLLSLRQSQEVEGSGCVNYPTHQFSSYRDCDAAFLSAVCQDLNLTPFWAAANLTEVTREAADPGTAGRLQLWNLFDGSRESDCARPCLATTVRGSELAEWRTGAGASHSTLAFSFTGPHQAAPSLGCFS